MGGKTKVSNDISNIINKFSEEAFVSLFCGACSIESKIISNKKICNDLHPYLIELLIAVQNGYELPDKVTKDTYDYIKANKDIDKALTGFIGFGCSFGGRWFEGYAKNNKGTNYAKESKNGLLKKMRGLKSDTTIFVNKSYKDVEIPSGAAVYCDPPYRETKSYSNSNKFNYEEFWEYMRFISKTHMVFISEIACPDDFVSIWKRDVKRILDVNKENIFKSTENLFIHKSNYNKYLEVVKDKV